MKRLLTIGHSYVVAANRVLAHQMALQGQGAWEVTAVAPARFHGDLREITAEAVPGEACRLETVPVHLDRIPHLMWYDGLARVLEQPWDVIHCWEEPYVFAAAQLARKAPRTSALVYATFQNLSKDYPWPLSAFERTTMRRADGWIAFGETVHAALSPREGYAATPSRVIPPGVDVDRFAPDAAAGQAIRDRLGWPVDACVAGYLGRFVPEKGMPLLLEALAAARADWRALFVGGGPMEAELRAFADRHPGRVHVQTGVPHDEVPAWLNAMSILCAPSQTTTRWREQFGRMLIESMACGVPVVASDSGEMPFVVGEAGIVLPEGDVVQWTAAIDHLLGSADLRARYAASGLSRARERFAWRIVAAEHLSFFDRLVEESCG